MPNLRETRFADMLVGDSAEFSVALTEDLVARFAELSGDINPLHTEESFAKTTDFGGRIAHGMLGASFFSQLVGVHLPGTYALYLSQNLTFRSPMRIGQTLLVRGTVKQKVDALRVIKLETQVLDQESLLCLIDGEAIIKVLQ